MCYSQKSGTCGYSSSYCSWTFENGKLTIVGTDKYNSDMTFTTMPWSSIINQIETVEISGVRGIHKYAFKSSRSLKSVTMTNEVTMIRYGAFYECSSLEKITFSNKIDYIEQYAFFGCSSLKSVVLPDSLTKLFPYSFKSCSSLEDLVIGNKLSLIQTQAFASCKSLRKIKIPFIMTTFQLYAFNETSKVSDLIIYGNGKINDYSEKNYSPWNVFRENVTKIEIEEGITRIGDYAFSNFISLKELTISNTTASIGMYAFNNCKSLETVIFNGISQPKCDNTVFQSIPFFLCENITLF